MLKIHFVALFSQKPNVIPNLLHRWPGNFMEFFSVMNILSEQYIPETLVTIQYHIIVPSLPGYAFSSPRPLTRDFQLNND